MPVAADFLKCLSVNADEESPQPVGGDRACATAALERLRLAGVGVCVRGPGPPALGLHPEEELRALCSLWSLVHSLAALW